MKISLIVAMANNRVIGRGNQMPWHLPADLKHFKSVTMGKPVVMGRRTFESIGRPLPGRLNIVISRNSDWHCEGVETATSLDDALSKVQDVTEVMVIGGGQLYAQALPIAQTLYLTHISLDVSDADTWFPEYHPEQWNLVDVIDCEPDEKNPYQYRFETLHRK